MGFVFNWLIINSLSLNNWYNEYFYNSLIFQIELTLLRTDNASKKSVYTPNPLYYTQEGNKLDFLRNKNNLSN